MYYKIVEPFGPQSGGKWYDYLKWRGLKLTRFDSVDGLLRPDLFEPLSVEDWHNCVNKDFRLNLITSLDYARSILGQHDNAVLVGVEIELQKGYDPKSGLLGFDIMDDYGSISLVTDWGTDEEGIINNNVMKNGLIGDFDRALIIRDLLRVEYSEDPHANNCGVWAVYQLEA
ncbi:MAG: hypothetical protein JW719_14590 [Pirellulales bacterium]|nr:hypothetical protein [Pirellulales bacterium]